MARRKILPIFVPHLGCPHRCVFCDQNRISGSPCPVTGAETAQALQKARADGLSGLELAFYGGSFTAIDWAQQRELLDAAAPFLRDGTVAGIRLSTRPDAVDAEGLARLRDRGVRTVELGAQSMDDRVLAASGRGHRAEDTERAARLVKQAGLALILQMMTGLPGSSPESDLQTARSLIALAPDGVRVYPTVIVRGTPLEAMWHAGQYREHTVDAAVSLCAELVPLFRAADIPIIRLGLNPTAELSAGGAVAGAYHPAFGELVRSELLRRQAMALLADAPKGARVTLGVAPKNVSAMTGQHRRNIAALTSSLGLGGLAVRPSPDAGDEVVILDVKT